jgi:urease accessory protein
MHLASASLPVGGFAYSQGLELMCESGRVCDLPTAQRWIHDYLMLVVVRQELPWWLSVYRAGCQADWSGVIQSAHTMASLRETAELRLESRQMAHALLRLYVHWFNIPDPANSLSAQARQAVGVDYGSAHAFLCAQRGLPEAIGLSAWLWAWLDNQILAAVKLVPLGQQDGQLLTHALKAQLPEAISSAQSMPIEQAGTAAYGLAIASAQHETQYARLFRS